MIQYFRSLLNFYFFQLQFKISTLCNKFNEIHYRRLYQCVSYSQAANIIRGDNTVRSGASELLLSPFFTLYL